MLSQAEARDRLASVRAVIVDEWHELLGNKRGVQVELALARLRRWNPALRTWGLSATLGNLDEALERLLAGAPGRVVRGVSDKPVVIDTLIPADVDRFPWAGHLGLAMLADVVAALEESRSTLVFTNTRSQAEIWYQALIEARPDWAGIVALHHGSLDAEVRRWVEEGLKAGRLKAVVATSSLDLGVDFSPVDRVLQIGSPKGVARLLQRAGRSGHAPGQVSRVSCVPSHALEFVEAAAARRAAQARRIEARRPVDKPLDVLAQHLVTIAAGEGFVEEALKAEVKSTRAFRDLDDAEWRWALDFVTRGGESLKAYPEYRRVEEVDGWHVVRDAAIARRHRMSVGTIVSDASMDVRFLNGRRLGQRRGVVHRVALARRRVRVRRARAGADPGGEHDGAGAAGEAGVGDGAALAGRAKPALQRAGGERARAPGGAPRGPRGRAGDARGRAAPRAAAHVVAHPAPPGAARRAVRDARGAPRLLLPLRGAARARGALGAARLAAGAHPAGVVLARLQRLRLRAPVPRALRAAAAACARDCCRPRTLLDDVLASLNAAELSKRQFREIARVAGLVFQGYPGQPKTNKQVQATSGLIYEVFARWDAGNPLLAQAEREVLERELEFSRLATAMRRLAGSPVVLRQTHKPTPFAFPLMVARLREKLTSEKLADRVRRMQLDFDRAADDAIPAEAGIQAELFS